MSLSPTKHRALSRQTSSTSLNVGLPPPLPESSMMSPSSSSRTLKRSRSRPRIRRGDVESSATSADEYDDEPLLVPAAQVKASPSVDLNLTPRRKVAGPIEPATVGRQPKKRETLQERLAAAAKLKKSRSVGEGLSSTFSVGGDDGMSLSAAGTAMRDGSGSSAGTSDKVVVCVRIKPTSSPFLTNAYELAPTSLELSDHHPNVIKRGGKQGREAEYAYTFDMLLKQPSKTPDLYSSQVAPLVEKAMNGFNSTVFAYGQTGSGKSFTMTGHPAELGIIPCAVDGVFDAITVDMDRAFLLRVSYIEIYNETLRDLLNFKKNKDAPAIHTNKGKVYVEPLVEEIVSTPQDVMKLLSKGNEGRKVGATDWNDRSSRSHCVFTIVIESRPRDGDGDDDIRLSRLNLIDLAGSEKAVSDLERRGEGKHINQSLLALREVINKLTEKKRSHIPYRNSKLTHLLENALGGDSNICVICTISAEEEHASETLETLKFAGRCSQVETKAKKNVLLSSERALIRAKDAEIDELKNRLQHLVSDGVRLDAPSSSSHVSELADSVADLENRKARLKDQLAKLNGEILTSEMPRLGYGLPLSPPQPKRRRISEFLGVGKPKGAASDRRAVSGLAKVEEDFAMIVDTEALEDAAVSTLRKALTAKDVELSRLRAEVVKLRTQATSTETHMLDTAHDLESTRADLVSTLSSKTAQIDSLEEAVLDLRKSREDLLVEDQVRLDEVQRKLNIALTEQERAKRVATGDLPTDLAMEKEAHHHDLEQLRKSHKIEVERLRAEVRKGAVQLKDRWAVSEEAIGARKAVEGENLELRKEVDKSREATSRYASLLKDQDELKGRYEEVKDKAKRVDFLESANSAMKAELDRLAALDARSEALEAAARSDSAKIAALEASLAEVGMARDHVRAEAVAAVARVGEMEVAAESAKEEAEKREMGMRQQRDQAQADLLDFQRKAMSTESEAVGVLRKQLAEKTEELARAVEAREAGVRVEQEKTATLAALGLERDAVRSELAVSLVEQAKLRQDLISADEAHTAKLSVVETERETARSELTATRAAQITLQATLESGTNDILELGKSVTTLRATVAERDGRIAQLEPALSDVTRQLSEARDATGDKDQVVLHLQADLAKLAKELDVANMTKFGVQAELEAVRSAAAAADEKAQKLGKELDERRQAVDLLEQQVNTASEAANKEVIRAEAAEMEAKRMDEVAKASAAELETARAATAAAEAKAQKLGGELDERRKAVVVLEQQINAASEAVKKEMSRAEAAEKEAERINKTAKAQAAELEGQLVQVRADLKDRMTNVGAAHASLELLRTELKNAEDRVLAVTASAASTAVELATREQDLVVLREQLAEKELALTQTQVSSASGDAKIQQLRGEVDDLTRQLENQGSVTSSLHRQVDEEQAKRSRAEKDFKTARASAASSAVSAAELQLARSELSVTQSKVSNIEKDLRAAHVRIEGLTKELTDARAAQRPNRMGGLPTIHSSSSLSNLAGAASSSTSRSNISAMRERAEIERLEKVIESQQTVIDDQREKIKFWSNELDKQREVVKMLTSAPDFNLTPTKSSPMGTRHMKAQSLSSTGSPMFSPPTPAQSAARGMPKQSLTSTFTARNLAFSTIPTTLPMHTAQYSNTAARKGRGGAVDHEKEGSSGTSKVEMAKAMWESPDKNGLRSGVAGWSDSPKQRRP